MEYYTLAVYSTLVEAELVEIYLESHGVSVHIPDRYIAMNIWHLSGMGGVRVQVSAFQMEYARSLIQDVIDDKAKDNFNVF